ncbi:hypothetical protein OKW21_004573 [Catalinimonas alkaloidigena]|uniref:hypothetical protein n=1 Tax=Catalinimonas alkaloidigena TaxID=1075417 RepID=UPI0024053D20|nr:hypothetical protein [Catalinimonas alkaloidigena]MDF9799310.1 hypothetical protein [Catalinimonas alkaloidigena]
MKKILKSIIAAVLVLIAMSASAHQPDISSLTLLEHESGKWTLQLNASMTAFQYEVRNAYGDDSYASPEEFNQLLVNHLKEHIALQLNKENVTLENGLVRLGHATTVAFELSGVPEAVEEVFVENRGFENIHHSQIIFSIVKEELDKFQFILNEENNFQISLSLEDNQILLAETSWNSKWAFGAISIVVAGLLGFLFYRSRFRKTFLAPKRLTRA